MGRLAVWMLVPAAAALLVLGFRATGAWADAERWPIRWLEVEGDLQRVTAAQVRAAIADQARRGFFVIDIDDARQAVEALPWVAESSVSRRWPDALLISVVEQRAVARWNGESLLGIGGEVFEVAGTAGMQGLTQLVGPDSRRKQVFDQWRKTSARLASIGIEIRQLGVDARGAWTLELANGRVLLLGREQIEQRLQRYISVRSNFSDIAQVSRVDLRYPNGLALLRGPKVEAELSARPESNTGAQPNHG
ncbi:MAG: FtsQ-type POTRA domain-containing protein [Wenzhouxiangellaceae bacterium]|nr:FtsQ-type POTRA domain-containing protein [Wenzhouxiangellaceae bacterium]